MDNDYNRQMFVDTIEKLVENYRNDSLLSAKGGMLLPKSDIVISILDEIEKILFPTYFGEEKRVPSSVAKFPASRIDIVFETLSKQICAALCYMNQDEPKEPLEAQAIEITVDLIKKLPSIQEMLLKDIQAGFDGDPAAQSKEEIILCYPGFYAIFVHRIAHELYIHNVPIIPRIMTEYAHTRSGIDINAGATIGEYFFIDHGTGVVVGETTVIGNNVKLYQGVTLGALSTRGGQLLAGVKRHPTIGDNVTIYSGASILGGETVIGENSVIGGNAFITESVPPNTKVNIKVPEHNFKQSPQTK